jgi:hypothetical protein
VKGYTSVCAIRDPERARECFEREYPGVNVGIACGASGLAVIDCDERNGGRDSFDALCNEIGCDWFGGCPRVTTPSNGFHLYFKDSALTRKRRKTILGPGLDLLSGGLGVIAPPSTRTDGSYRRVGGFPESFSPPPFPAALLESITAKVSDSTPKHKLTREMPSVIPGGQRNATLTSLAGRLLCTIGPVSEEELFGHLRMMNDSRCQPLLPEDEVRAIAHSVISYGGPSVDPWLWYKVAQSRLTTPGEFRTAFALAELAAKCGRSAITPAALYICRQSGIPRTTYFRAKKSLERKGCIHIAPRRSREAPQIELADEVAYGTAN